MQEPVSRRNVIKAGALAAPAILSAQNVNSKLRAGWIGTGSRGNHVMNMAYGGSAELMEVTAVCDTYAGNLARAKDNVQSKGKNTPKTYVDYKDLLADPNVDVVFIMTPEHLHHRMLLDAVKANKHAYVEKPLAHTIEEGAEIVSAVEKSAKLVQVGTQNRSNSLYIQAKKMVEDGLIGDIHYVRAFWYRNSLDDNPAWRYKIPDDAAEANTDWKKFLGVEPYVKKDRAFDKQRYYQWRLYWDYSGGISTDLLVHQTDITNFVCGKAEPSSCMASGGIYRWTEDDREVPDTLSAIYEYPGKFHINYSCYFGNDWFGYGEQFMGNEGTIEVLNRQILNFYPEKFGGKPPAKVAARKTINVHLPGNDVPAVQNHVRNLFEAIAGKAKLVAPVKVGQQAAIGGHLATLSYRNGKKVLWDERTQKYRFA
ncbi:MAG: Gfo/Idh/MocA family oxidoreductase [Bryobacteraceae bacterium]|nr:Gfo/Idh/MocA family oxidoreductase [Bryobacteraceae bacterium]